MAAQVVLQVLRHYAGHDAVVARIDPVTAGGHKSGCQVCIAKITDAVDQILQRRNAGVERVKGLIVGRAGGYTD